MRVSESPWPGSQALRPGPVARRRPAPKGRRSLQDAVDLQRLRARERPRRSRSYRSGRTMMLTRPVSSSRVRNRKPLAVPGRWRQITAPGHAHACPSRSRGRSHARRIAARGAAPARWSDHRMRADGDARAHDVARAAARRSVISGSGDGAGASSASASRKQRPARPARPLHLPQRAAPREAERVERARPRPAPSARRGAAPRGPRGPGATRTAAPRARRDDAAPPPPARRPAHVAQAEPHLAVLERAGPVAARHVHRPEAHAVALRVLHQRERVVEAHRLVVEQRAGEGRRVVRLQVRAGVGDAARSDAACDSGKP